MEDVPNTDHFSIIENLVDEEYHLTKVEHTHQTLFLLLMVAAVKACMDC